MGRPVTAPPDIPLIPPREVDARQELPELEQEVLERWRERDVFGESLRNRDGAEQWVFYEGPPTANGRPGSHHVLSRVFKDIYPRYKTMRGYRVERKGGWDCHGLPVEIAVEQKLGITSKTEIEQYGIKEFNEQCRNSVFEYLEEWDRLTERIGFWVDLEHAYRTLDESYIESVWWALKTISDKGLLYEGHKVVPYCYRCGTALSSHEVALGYKDVVDPVGVRAPADNRRSRSAAGRRCAADLDDDAVDAAGERRGSSGPRASSTHARSWVTRRWSWRRRLSRGCWARTRRSSTLPGERVIDGGQRGRRPSEGAGQSASGTSGATARARRVLPVADLPHRRARQRWRADHRRRFRDNRGRHWAGAHRARVWGRRLPGRRRGSRGSYRPGQAA